MFNMRKVVTQNLVITALSKGLSFLSFIYISRTLTVEGYGTYVYLALVLSLLPLLQLGSKHGALILLPRYISDDNKSENRIYLSYSYISHLCQIISIFLFFIFDSGISSFLVVIISVNFFLSKNIENIQLFLNAKHDFYKSNIIKFFDQVIRPTVIIALFSFYKNIESIFVAQLLVTIFIFIMTFAIYRVEIFKIKLDLFIKDICEIYKIGFYIYAIWLLDILFRSADRWFISQFYSMEELGTYGFVSTLAMNIWLVAISFFSPYAQVMYRHIATKEFDKVDKLIDSTNRKLFYLLFLASITSVIAYPILIDFIMNKFHGTEWMFFILVVTSIFLSLNNMQIYYLMTTGSHFTLLKYQLFSLCLNVALNMAFVYLHLDILFFCYSTLISILVYFFMVRRYYVSDIKMRLLNE